MPAGARRPWGVVKLPNALGVDGKGGSRFLWFLSSPSTSSRGEDLITPPLAHLGPEDMVALGTLSAKVGPDFGRSAEACGKVQEVDDLVPLPMQLTIRCPD